MIKSMASLAGAEWRRQWKVMTAYPFELVTSSLSFLIITFGILFGISKLGSGLQMFGVIVFPLVMNIIGGMSASIRADVQIGTFDQVYNSPYTLFQISLVRTMISSSLSLIISVLTALLVYFFFFPFHIGGGVLLYSIFVLILLSFAISSLLAAFTLLFRKIDAFLNLVNIFLLLVLTLPYYNWPSSVRQLLALILPYSGLIQYIQAAAEGNPSGAGLWMMTANLLLWLLGSGLTYTASLRIARKAGTLGMY